MDTFITTIMVIYDNINKEKADGPRLINNKITEKQFLAYYIYRLWIKYRKLMEDVNTPTAVRKVLKYMEVPIKYHAIYLTYPMADKMPINEKQLDLIILSMLKQLNQTYKVYGQRADGSIPPENKDYKMLAKYLTGKTIENIIQDVIQVKLLVPNLSRPANVRNIWEGIDQMLDDIDVIEPIVFQNPASEIPDSKLIGNDSDTRAISTISDSDIMPLQSNNTSSSINRVNNSSSYIKPTNTTPLSNTTQLNNISRQTQQLGNTKLPTSTSNKPVINSNSNRTRNISSNKLKNSNSVKASNVSNSSKVSSN
jgi:hypothetical protein